MLLDQGASVNAIDKDGRTALVHAVLRMDANKLRMRFVQLLCDHGADIYLKDNSGRDVLNLLPDIAVPDDHEQLRVVLLQNKRERHP